MNLSKLTSNLISSPLMLSHNLQQLYVVCAPPAPLASLPLFYSLFVIIIPVYKAYEIMGSLISSHFYKITTNLNRCMNEKYNSSKSTSSWRSNRVISQNRGLPKLFNSETHTQEYHQCEVWAQTLLQQYH